jgi:hypothetical protein
MPTLAAPRRARSSRVGVGKQVMKTLVAAALSAVLAVATLPLLFAGGDIGHSGALSPCSGLPGPGASVGAVDTVLATIRQQESGGDYGAEAAGSSASGAYQFTDATWDGYRGYARAADAPPQVQDAKAAAHAEAILAAHDGDVAAVPVAWYLGYVPAPGDPAWDRVPAAGTGNRLTPRQYQAAWLAAYAERTGSPSSPPGGSSAGGPDACSSPQQTTDVDLVSVEGIVVNTGIADQVARLVASARRAGFRLAGGGYRSADEQVALRRQNCGTSPYAIYEAPAASCSPPTARPGSSNHERGLAVDFTCDGQLIRSRSSACFQWMADNAGVYGLYNLPSEPWHWSHDSR